MARFHLDERTRAFAREVGGIVLGVLIALAFGEVADAVRHRVNAHRVLTAIRSNTSTWEVRALPERCARDRLTSIARELDHARLTDRLRDIGEIGSSPTRSFRVGNWESAVGKPAVQRSAALT